MEDQWEPKENTNQLLQQKENLQPLKSPIRSPKEEEGHPKNQWNLRTKRCVNSLENLDFFSIFLIFNFYFNKSDNFPLFHSSGKEETRKTKKGKKGGIWGVWGKKKNHFLNCDPKLIFGCFLLFFKNKIGPGDGWGWIWINGGASWGYFRAWERGFWSDYNGKNISLIFSKN